jgi:hypothetical protein
MDQEGIPTLLVVFASTAVIVGMIVGMGTLFYILTLASK